MLWTDKKKFLNLIFPLDILTEGDILVISGPFGPIVSESGDGLGEPPLSGRVANKAKNS